MYTFDKELFSLKIDDVIFECLAPHISKMGRFETTVVVPNCSKLNFLSNSIEEGTFLRNNFSP